MTRSSSGRSPIDNGDTWTYPTGRPYPIKMNLRSIKQIKSSTYRKPPEIKRVKTKPLINANGKVIGHLDTGSGVIYDASGNRSQALTTTVLGRVKKNKKHIERVELAGKLLMETASE